MQHVETPLGSHQRLCKTLAVTARTCKPAAHLRKCHRTPGLPGLLRGPCQGVHAVHHAAAGAARLAPALLPCRALQNLQWAASCRSRCCTCHAAASLACVNENMAARGPCLAMLRHNGAVTACVTRQSLLGCGGANLWIAGGLHWAARANWLTAAKGCVLQAAWRAPAGPRGREGYSPVHNCDSVVCTIMAAQSSNRHGSAPPLLADSGPAQCMSGPTDTSCCLETSMP